MDANKIATFNFRLGPDQLFDWHHGTGCLMYLMHLRGEVLLALPGLPRPLRGNKRFLLLTL